MSLIVRTARITYSGSDRIDVTRKGCTPDGWFMAPSWKILAPVLRARSSQTLEQMWGEYVENYKREMEESRRLYPLMWRELLSLTGATLVCYCTNPLRCHRWILRTQILPELGAVDGGEVTS